MISLRRVPPPPYLPRESPQFNKWLHDLTQFISANGGIDNSQIDGFSDLQNSVEHNTTEIHLLQQSVASLQTSTGALQQSLASLQSSVLSLNASVATLQTSVAALQTVVSALQGNPVVRNPDAVPSSSLGNNGDLAVDAVNHHVYSKRSGAWVLIV